MGTQLDYYTFMGFNPEELRLRYATYADRFLEGARVLDVGCGRGEFLELLATRKVAGIGIDADEAMVSEVKRKGLQAVATEAVSYLQAHPAEFDGVFAAHLIEHMGPEAVQGLVRVAAKALKPEGRLILVTPNPQNLQMQLRDFWIDLQHIRFYSVDIVRWIVHEAGLREIEIGYNPSYRSGPALAHQRLPELPIAPPPVRSLDRRIVNKLYRAMRRNPTQRRLVELERRTNALFQWMQGLYPPAEYYVTGMR
jgi:O-antigen chain-terminating methyltransferase